MDFEFVVNLGRNFAAETLRKAEPSNRTAPRVLITKRSTFFKSTN
jgi:hypothetical protein